MYACVCVCVCVGKRLSGGLEVNFSDNLKRLKARMMISINIMI